MTPSQARTAILAGTAPDGLEVGGSLDLGGCTGLTALPDGLEVGGSLYLRGCTGLENVTWLSEPAGNESRRGPVCRVNGGTRISLGCWLGTPEATYAAIAGKYGKDSDYERIVREAVAAFEAPTGDPQ